MTTRALQKARLFIPFTARRSKGPIKRDQQCQVTEYILYSARETCDLCRTDAKAERQVVISCGETTLRSGINCLEDVSGITARHLEDAVKGNLSVALRLHHGYEQGFADEAAMLAYIEGMLDDVPQGNERQQITVEIHRLKSLAHFNPKEVRWLEEVIDLVALYRFAKSDPTGYDRMLEAAFGHPGKPAEEARSRLNQDLLQKRQLTMTLAAEFRKALRKLRDLPTPLRFNPTIAPWEFPYRDSYHRGLEAHFRGLADSGSVDIARLQVQFDAVHKSQRPPVIEDFLTRLGVPCVLPVYQHEVITSLDFTSPQSLRLIENANTLPSGFMNQQFYLSPVVHEADVRTDNEQSRVNNHGKTRPPEAGETTTVPFRNLALWRPDPWHAVYSLWHTHGKDQLLTFPQLT